MRHDPGQIDSAREVILDELLVVRCQLGEPAAFDALIELLTSFSVAAVTAALVLTEAWLPPATLLRAPPTPHRAPRQAAGAAVRRLTAGPSTPASASSGPSGS